MAGSLSNATDPLVLVADDDQDQRQLLERWLTTAGYRVQSFSDGYSCVEALSFSLPEAICLDLHMPGLTGLEALEKIGGLHPRLPVLILTADAEVDHVVEAMKLGAYDYLVKPLDRTKLTTTVRNAIEHGSMAVRLAQLETEVEGGGYAGIVGESPQMRAIYRQIERVAPSEISVVIYGESGTGKELVAQAIHARSGRARRPFVALNCAAIHENLQESELFGHEKGAFSGAYSRRTGRFEEADGGTLFLDEIAELSLRLQAKLLRVLQERTFRRVGGSRELTSDFRLLAATHKNLGEEVEAGQFREDLFYRVSVFDLHIPPLRERGQDLLLLVRHFLDELAKTGREVRLAEETLAVLKAHRWPGNVRELRNALERAAVAASADLVRPEDLPARVHEPSPGAGVSEGAAVATPDGRAPEELAAVTAAEIEDTVGKGSSPDGSVENDGQPLTLAQIERRAIETAFDRTGGNRTKMARELGIGRTTLYRKLKEYSLD